MQTYTIAILAAVSSAVSAQYYGGYGGYGAPSPMVEVIDITPEGPSPSAMVQDITPSPMAAVQDITPSPSSGQGVMPIEELQGTDTTLEGCMVQHNRDELELCEQCMPGYFQAYDADGNIICILCEEFSPSCKTDDTGLYVGCQSFAGCPVCTGEVAGVQIESFPGNNFYICEQDL